MILLVLFINSRQKKAGAGNLFNKKLKNSCAFSISQGRNNIVRYGRLFYISSRNILSHNFKDIDRQHFLNIWMEAFGKSNGDGPITMLERSRKTLFSQNSFSFPY